MKVLYNYKPYQFPMTGLFNITTDVYDNGWKLSQEKKLIIGEDDDSYVYQLLNSGHGEWVGEKVIQHKYILPIGIHKSRLVKWVAGQLQFEF